MPTNKVRAPSFAEIREQIAEAIRRTAVNPGLSGYRPMEHQTKFHKSDSQGKLFLGGNRAGKTVAGGTEDVMWLTGLHPYRNIKKPPIKGRIIGSDFDDGINKVMKPEIARWMPQSYLINGSWEDSYSLGNKTLTLNNGSTVEFMSYDQDIQKFAGTSRDFVHFDEEPPEDIFNENMLRLLDVGGSWWLTMTPLIDMSWTYDRLFEKALAGGTVTLEDGTIISTLEMFQASVFDNVHINAQQVAILTEGLSDEEKLARIQGKYFSYVGSIYGGSIQEDTWISPIHTSDFWPIYYSRWTHFGMLDHGFTNPTAFYLGCYNEEGQIIIYYEYYEKGRVVKENAEAIIQLLKDLKLLHKVEYMVGDPSMWNTDPITGTSVAQEYSENGLNFGKANNDVRGGINRVMSRFKTRAIANNKPLLMITENCEKAKWEIARYRWKKWDTSKASNKNNPREEPQKKDDHAMDAIRYGVVSRPQMDTEPNLSVGNVLQAPIATMDRWEDPDLVWERDKEPDQFDEFLGSDY